MTGIWAFVVGVWNAAVSIFPVVAHTICEVVKTSSDAVKLGGGS